MINGQIALHQTLHRKQRSPAITRVSAEMCRPHYIISTLLKCLHHTRKMSFHVYVWLKYTKGVIRIRKSKKNRQHNGQKKKYKRTNSDTQSIYIKLNIE
jgi:hypothetical protein